MNKIVLSLLAFFICLACFSQNQPGRGRYEQVCRTGFTYEISNSPQWGYGKPVITSIQPYSSAEQNGLQINDIIEYIDSTAITDIPLEEIVQLLNIEGKDETILTVSNISSETRRIWINKECKPAQAVTEAQLAKAFYLYSPETTAERVFNCPFTITTTMEQIDFSNFKTFAFAGITDDNSQLELIINECIEQELLKKGMNMDFTNPDILIHTYYFFDKNPQYKGKNKIEINRIPVYRFDPTTKKIISLPFLHQSAAGTEAEYLLQLGIRLSDQKITPGRTVWECEANELLDDVFTLENYARIHIPLMCMQYPYVKYSSNVPYRIDQTIYNYTGILYDIEDIGRIIGVDRNSPAAIAGIRRGDRIEMIGEKTLPDSWDVLSGNYEEFVKETTHFRNPSTRFRHPDYPMETMYWDDESYTQIADAFRKPDNNVPFAYLFSYAPYIDSSSTNRCKFVIKRGNNQQEYFIRPSLRAEQTLSIEN